MTKMGVSDRSDQERLIKKAATYIFRTENVYSDTLLPGKDGWDNAKKEWERVTGQSYADVEVHNEPIPALLIKKGWKKDANLHSYINRGMPSISSMVGSDLMSKTEKLTLGISIPVALVFLFLLAHVILNMEESFRENAAPILLGVTAFSAMIIPVVIMFRQIKNLMNGDKTLFHILLTIGSVSMGLLLGALAFIK